MKEVREIVHRSNTVPHCVSVGKKVATSAQRRARTGVSEVTHRNEAPQRVVSNVSVENTRRLRSWLPTEVLIQMHRAELLESARCGERPSRNAMTVKTPLRSGRDRRRVRAFGQARKAFSAPEPSGSQKATTDALKRVITRKRAVGLPGAQKVKSRQGDL